MRIPDYEPSPVEDWDRWFPDFTYTISRLMQEVEIERRHHVGGYAFPQSLTMECERERRLARLSAEVIRDLLDMLSGMPGWNVRGELDRAFGGAEHGCE